MGGDVFFFWVVPGPSVDTTEGQDPYRDSGVEWGGVEGLSWISLSGSEGSCT